MALSAKYTLSNNLQENGLQGNDLRRPSSRTYNGRGAVQEAVIPRSGSFRIFDKFRIIVSEGVTAKTASIISAPDPATKHYGAQTCFAFVRERSIEIVVGHKAQVRPARISERTARSRRASAGSHRLCDRWVAVRIRVLRRNMSVLRVNRYLIKASTAPTGVVTPAKEREDVDIV